jgi:hypothetical protein
MTTSTRSRRPDESVLMLAAFAALVVGLLLAYCCWRIGDWTAGMEQPIPVNPFAAFALLAGGRLAWPPQATVLTVFAEACYLAAGPRPSPCCPVAAVRPDARSPPPQR